VTLFLRNITVTENSLIAHGIEKELQEIRETQFNDITIGLHPHIQTCIDLNYNLIRVLQDTINSDIGILQKNGFQDRCIRCGGDFFCGALNKIFNNCKIELDSSEIYGREVEHIGHAETCIPPQKLSLGFKKIQKIPISTSNVNIEGVNKKVYFDFSFNNIYSRSLKTLNVTSNNPYIVTISHPSTFFTDVYYPSTKFVFGLDYWISNFLDTYNNLLINYDKIEFSSIYGAVK